MDEARGGGEEEAAVEGRRLQESTGPQIRDKAGLAPSILDLGSPYHLRARGIRRRGSLLQGLAVD